MSPRILDLARCRHCKAELPQPTPRVCPACGGSLQKRFLALGCLSSAPPPLIVGWLVLTLAADGRGSRQPLEPADATAIAAIPSAAAPAASPDAWLADARRRAEAIAMGLQHP